MPLQFELCPGRIIGDSHPCFIIAEIEQNHQGDIEIAKKIKMAKDCGADCAKFQKSKLEFKFSKKALEDIPWWCPAGMQSMETMRRVYKTVKEHNQNFTILQCISTYPLDLKYVHLSLITEYQKEFPDIPIGYSGHEQGIYITVAAVAMGAKVVECHVTLDKTLKGNDHEASLEPSELAELVRAIRLVETAMGSPVKQMLPCEKNKVGLTHSHHITSEPLSSCSLSP